MSLEPPPQPVSNVSAPSEGGSQLPNIKSTPIKTKTHSTSGFSSLPPVGTDNKDFLNFWANRLRNNGYVYYKIERYLEDFVPGDEPPLKKLPSDLFIDYKPRKGIEDCVGMANSLNKLMRHVPPERRITFAATRHTKFKAIFSSEHETRPDVSGTYPGQPAPAINAWDWKQCPIDVEIKSGPAKNPISYEKFKLGQVHDATLAQLAKNGRNLLAASGACFCFVIGVYGTYARIYRFDRAGAAISPSFNIKSSDIMFRFLWRLVHPARFDGIPPEIPTPKLSGLDATVTTLTKEEKEWLRGTLINVHHYAPEMAEDCVNKATKMLAMYTSPTALSGDAEPKWCYTIGSLSHSPGLFSRATKVMKVLFREDPNHFFAVKDAWRHLYRRNEMDFYDHIRRSYEPNYPPGVARGIGALDFGKDSRYPEHKTESVKKLKIPRDMFDDAEREAEQASQEDDEDITVGVPRPPESLAPRNRNASANLNRSHTRTTIYPVGERTAEFESTKQLVQAIRDAIEGHKALKECGILHRDISVDNVLRTTDQAFAGFVHDLDYSTYVLEMDEFSRKNPNAPNPLAAEYSDIPKDLKEITGTYQFMARAILRGEPHMPIHDLESFFWVLMWVVFRHVDHSGTLDGMVGQFDDRSSSNANYMKIGWLFSVSSGGQQIKVSQNPPLTRLLLELHHLILIPTGLDHDSLLGVFDDALSRSDWPLNDGRLPYKPIKSNPYEVGIGGVGTGDSSSSFTSSTKITDPTEKSKGKRRADAQAQEGEEVPEGKKAKVSRVPTLGTRRSTRLLGKEPEQGN